MMSGLFLSLDFFVFFMNLILINLIFLLLFMNMKMKLFFFLNIFYSSIKNSMPSNKIYLMKNILIYIFMLIFLMNFLSLYPHVFSLFSIMNLTLILSFSFWFSVMLNNFMYFLSDFMTHLTPISTPLMLMSFMVMIELVSQMIRPLTLLVRLGTNLTTGHLILGLISFFSFFSIIAQIPLFLLEIMVALVQAYVFNLLILLYSNE